MTRPSSDPLRAPVLARSLAAALLMLGLTMLAWFGFAHLLGLFDRTNALSLAARLSIFDWFAFELCIAIVAVMWLLNGGAIARAIGYGFFFLFVGATAIQLQALFMGQTYVSRLAVENFASIDLVLTPSLILQITGFVASLIGMGFVLERRYQRRADPMLLGAASVAVVLIAGLSIASSQWIPASVQDEREEYLSMRHLAHASPAFALLQVLGPQTPLSDRGPNWAADVRLAKQLGFRFNGLREFPLIKDAVYHDAPPFPRIGGTVDQPDVILFFIEGLSARSIGAYGGKIRRLTPNIDRFTKSTMQVTNYYSHTAATYRGIHGQLCSLFPYYGGIGGWVERADEIMETRYSCFNHLLKESGYESVFLDSTIKSDTSSYLDEMALSLGFDQVWTGDQLLETFLESADAIGPVWLSDHQMMDALIQMLKQRSPADDRRAPIFTSLYTIGTHAFRDIVGDGVRYGRGENISLNTIHNMDQAFGRFWRYFIESKHSKSTIIIFTTDHAHFQERPFMQIAGRDYKPWFVDRIPLLVYDPTRTLPSTFDAKNRSSIDFAPSFAHFLGLPPQRLNPFLGRSIFESRPGEPRVGVGAIGNAVFLYDDRGVHVNGASRTNQETLQSLNRFIQNLYRVELDNRIWPGDAILAHERD